MEGMLACMDEGGEVWQFKLAPKLVNSTKLVTICNDWAVIYKNRELFYKQRMTMLMSMLNLNIISRTT